MGKSTSPAESFVGFTKAEIQQSIPEKFEQIVRNYPDKIAIGTPTHTLSYEELNMTANRVAQSILTHLGERPEPIALLMEHDAAAIIGILGVLKADKFYVPLDPRHPHTRNSYILSDTRARLVLTNTLSYSRARELVGNTTDLLDVDTIDSQISAKETRLYRSPDRLAYVIYTSGSTGTPKGVMQNHRNVLQRVITYTNSVRISPNDRVALLYSYSSSGSVRDIFGALLNGATLLPFELREEGWAPLTKWLIREEITVYNSAATVFRHFAENLSEEDRFPKLRSIHVGSETICRRDVEFYKAHFSDECVFVARLGSTEISPICEYPVHKKTEIIGNTVPAGYVVGAPEAQVLLLDENGKEVRLNEIGEIAVKSPYLFLGYWERPDLTQAAFVPDPSGGAKPVFRTGDLGRMRFDGCVEHLGRKDYQVKIRGHRVEIGEIEAALGEHPQVREAAVVLSEDTSEKKRLVAYVVLFEPEIVMAGSVRSVRNFLKTKLPEFMIPASFLIVDALPRTANGKLDRSKLIWRDVDVSGQSSAAATLRPELENPFVAPSNPVEEKIAHIWSGLLNIDTIGIHDDFFDLGGDSLLAVQLMAAIEQTFDRRLLPAVIFQAPTIERIALLLQHKGDTSLPSIIPIRPTGSKLPFFWIHGGPSNASLLDYLEPDQPVYGLEHQSQDGLPAKYTSVETIAEYYLRQIRQIQPHGPFLIGGYSFGGTIAFEVAQNLTAHGEKISLLAILDSPFPTASRPPSSTDRDESFENPTKVSPRWLKIGVHFQRLAKLGFQAQVRYLHVRFKGRINAIGNKLRTNYKWLLCKASLTVGWRLPASVRSYYIVEVHKVARKAYKPRVFLGRAVYFKSTNRSSYDRDSWQNLMRDGMEVYEVPGDHLDLIKRENVSAWAGRLGSCITKAHAL